MIDRDRDSDESEEIKHLRLEQVGLLSLSVFAFNVALVMASYASGAESFMNFQYCLPISPAVAALCFTPTFVDWIENLKSKD